MIKKETKTEVANEPSYTKTQILTFVRYAHRRDLLIALLKEEEIYTHADVVSAMRDFMEGGRG